MQIWLDCLLLIPDPKWYPSLKESLPHFIIQVSFNHINVINSLYVLINLDAFIFIHRISSELQV